LDIAEKSILSPRNYHLVLPVQKLTEGTLNVNL